MKRTPLFVVLMALCCFSCQEHHSTMELNGGLILPENKVWAHGVNDTQTAQIKEKQFEGMELDLIYSSHQNQLFVGHNEKDTLKGLTLEQWFAALEHPEKMYFWLDMKNLSYQTADSIAVLIHNVLAKYHLIDRAFVENPDSWCLKKVKAHQLHTSLWVSSFRWSSIDTTTWVEKVNQQIQNAHPDAISCEYGMFEALTTYFDDQNIFLWHTPVPYTAENAELTQRFCNHPSVKIVLVDYDTPNLNP